MSRGLSVGICAHNEEETIGKLIDQLMEEDIPVKEVIVVVAGDDSTAEIVRERMDRYSEIILVEEEEREGQSRAQNKILSRMTGEALLMVDGDGTIEPGSLEKLYGRFNGDNIVAGKEVPVTEDSFLGSILEVYGDIHNELCKRSPRFTTQIGIIPSGLIDSFPDVVLDDAYIEHVAEEKNLPTVYEPGAVKHHSLPHTFRFFFHQQKKNWAGRFQMRKNGYSHNKPQGLLLRVYLEKVKDDFPGNILPLTVLGGVEVTAYLAGLLHAARGSFPTRWWRPGG